MNLDGIFQWILQHPTNYPGKAQESQPRTNPAYKPLEPKAQMHIVMNATGQYIKEKMLDGKGVNMNNFGAFTFEIFSDTVKPAQFSGFDITKDLNEQRENRKHVHKIRPCFIPDKYFRYALQRYYGKEEITAPKSQHSIYQKGFSMGFCNPGPIAISCFLGKEVVADIHKAFVQAVYDLTSLGHNLVIDFGFVQLKVMNRDLKYQYLIQFNDSLNQKDYELKMRKSDLPTRNHWLTTYQEKWNQSCLNSLLKRPNVQQVQDYYEKSLALKIMSLDLNSADKTIYSQQKKVILPQISKKQN